MKLNNLILKPDRNNDCSNVSCDTFINEWKHYSNSEKIDAIQSIANQYSNEIGLKQCPIFYIENRPGLYGSNYYRSNMITINLDACSNPYEALDTVIHELNHAYQYQSVMENDVSNYSTSELILIKSEMGADYISDGLGYDIQFVEADSNSTAYDYVREHVSDHNRIEYENYLYDRYNHYKDIVECVAQDSNSNELLKDQLDKALINNSIDNDELIVGKDYLENPAYYTDFNRLLYQSQEDYINNSIETSLVLHEHFSENQVTDDIDLDCFQSDSRICIDGLTLGKERIEQELNNKINEQRDYANQNKLTILSAREDNRFQEYNESISYLNSARDKFRYHIAELQTDNELLVNKEISIGHYEAPSEIISNDYNGMEI